MILLALLMILGATLWPMPGPSQEWATCLACGDHGTADLLLNVALFAPLGAALMRYTRHRIGYAVLCGALLSASIEVAQLYIPGRDASLGDLFANTLGTAVGALLVQGAYKTIARSRAATLVAVLVCFATGVLLSPAFPRSQYYGMWTPNLGHLAWYRGHVRAATLSGMRIVTGPIPDSRAVREALLSDRGYVLDIHAIAGPRPARLAPLFAIFDDRRREIILVGPDRDDLVFRFHTRAADWRFDRPDLRAVNALRDVAPGDSLAVSVTARAHAYDVRVNNRDYSRVGYEIGDGWALLLYPEALAPLNIILGAVWVGALFFPAGFWIRDKHDALFAGAGIVVSLLGAPLVTALLPTPAIQWIAGALGILAGVGVHVVTSRRRSGAPLPEISSSTSLPTHRSIRE